MNEGIGKDRVNRIDALIRAALNPTRLEIVDDSAAHRGHAGAASGAGHFNVVVVAEVFEGMAPLARHRMVFAAVDDMMHSDIHALSIKALTPAQDV